MTSDKDGDNKQCQEKNCAHFLNKNNISFYRHRFLWCVIIAIIAIVAWLFISFYQYNKSVKNIIITHETFCSNLNNDIDFLLNEVDASVVVDPHLLAQIKENHFALSHLLELQTSKIQSDYSILTLWASVLMIVFLVFSIYSMFKVDEMQKQGRDMLSKLEDSREKARDQIAAIEKMSKEEVEKISKTSEDYMNSLSKKIAEVEKSVYEQMNKRADEFQQTTDGFIKQMNQSYKDNQSMFKMLYEVFKENASNSKETRDVIEEKESKDK